ncbi:hypothetical protein BpHYR1_038989 [Brachionus plicatilis]|uniref:Uncharacterized protein n=1 Tax=Brachionus plicatilis TaxID=10195 RepID=A0A3M7R739_BRAPC|nr:hypothetical protein BpHYR1_038989 [Brachionus plicatilis]
MNIEINFFLPWIYINFSLFQTLFKKFHHKEILSKPRPNNGQRGCPSRPVCGSEPADLSDLADPKFEENIFIWMIKKNSLDGSARSLRSAGKDA